MKSNEEFIAGIYEKAAAYTEEDKKTNRTWKKNTVRVAAMVAICAGLTGTGAFVWNQTREQLPKDNGIALLSENTGEEPGAAMQFRRTLVTETVTFTGRVEQIDTKENRIWITLEFQGEDFHQAKQSMVCIYWNLPQEMDAAIKEGVNLTATGELSIYDKEGSDRYGCAELILTDAANLWLEEINR